MVLRALAIEGKATNENHLPIRSPGHCRKGSGRSCICWSKNPRNQDPFDSLRNLERKEVSEEQVNTNRWISTALLSAIAVTLSIVVISPIALSSQDLVKWAGSSVGLGLTGFWPYIVFIALDAAAALCIALTMHAAYRGESGGAAHFLVWVFAGMSAFANYSHSVGSMARDSVWFFPAMSILGAILLEVVIRRIRRLVKTNAGVYENQLPHFRTLRWIIARKETWEAFKSAVINGHTTPQQAIESVRIENQIVNTSLADMTKADAIRHAFTVLNTYDSPEVSAWLTSKGVNVHRAQIHSLAKKEQNK